jgi:S1-C subfamily serine protease
LVYGNFQRTLLAVALVACAATGLHAQEAATQSTPSTAPAGIPLAEQTTVSMPQVLTVVHRLSGLKVLRLLRRSGAQVAEIDSEFVTTRDSHTSIAAGFALGDGKTVVARLQQAEVEVEVADAPKVSHDITRDTAPELSDLTVIGRNGQRVAASYIGLDGWTGLSLLQIEGLPLTPVRDASEEKLQTGQRVRLFAPEPAGQAAGTASGTLYLRVGEIEGKLAEIIRASSGKVMRLIVHAPKLNPAMAGSLVYNEAGEMIGIVESSSSDTAYITPSAAVRSAAERVLARRTSTPRPWLGVRGVELKSASIEQLVNGGWKRAKATALVSKGEGILLTFVAPGTAAASGGLRAGDVISGINGRDVKGAGDFSLLLKEAESASPLRFMVLRPDVGAPRTLMVKLNEAMNPATAMETAEARAGHGQAADPFIVRGAETITLSPKSAFNLGAQTGRLVVFVQPGSAASRSGLRAGDVIESLDGRSLTDTGAHLSSSLNGSTQLSLGVVREGQKLKVILQK